MTLESRPEPQPDGWFKSSHSAAACTCVEVRFTSDHTIEIRYSKDPRCTLAPGTEPVIQLTIADWHAFQAELRVTRWTASSSQLRVVDVGGELTLQCLRSGTALLFNADEWRAFLAGVGDGEFERKQHICRLRNLYRRPARNCTNKPQPY